ncbi:transposase family protein [Pilimelia columellifera]|uniref:DDE Tnp4 domain-containing protein n=1 Tax=Pilimelia columellifera subsp. columellifera TaxID=706583 RepID=A0ABN3N2B0_9ACTN
MLTPIKKPAFRELLGWDEEYNSGINGVRWVIEQVIAYLKTWRTLHVGYRRPIETFRETISVVVALQF